MSCHSSHAGCKEVIKAVADKALELSIIVNQKSTTMKKTISTATEQNTKDIKAKQVSIELPDLLSELTKENSELGHVNAVIGGKIGELIKNNPKCFK